LFNKGKPNAWGRGEREREKRDRREKRKKEEWARVSSLWHQNYSLHISTTPHPTEVMVPLKKQKQNKKQEQSKNNSS